jgi:2,4-diketo-3-deoxy-L-fuconate hydrolase
VRFNDTRLGVLLHNDLRDVSAALDAISQVRWPLGLGDALVANLPRVLERVAKVLNSAPSVDLPAVRIDSPVANPSKIVAVPINYRDHIAEIAKDPVMLQAMGGEIKPLRHYGLILKAVSSLRGPGQGIQIAFPDRRNDHEVELAIIIGRSGFRIAPADAYAHVAGYAVGLDITLRGTEERSLRKSLDSYSIVGPCLTTADEIERPDNLRIGLSVNGVTRQSSTTAEMVLNIREVVAFASSFFTLCPGDVIMTGTPGGVGPIVGGDVIDAWVQGVGSMRVSVSA